MCVLWISVCVQQLFFFKESWLALHELFCLFWLSIAWKTYTNISNSKGIKKFGSTIIGKELSSSFSRNDMAGRQCT